MDIHGDWQLRVVRDVVVSTLSGAWNEEGAVAYYAEYQQKTEHLSHFATIAHYAGWTGNTPEAAVVLDKVRRWAFDHGCVGTAWVLEDPLMKRWIDLYLRQNDGLHEVRAFAAVAEAVEWLATKGFLIDPAEVFGAAAEPSTGAVDARLGLATR